MTAFYSLISTCRYQEQFASCSGLAGSTSAINIKRRPGFKHRTMQRRLVNQEGKNDNREPWWRANGPAPTARKIASAFLKYAAAPLMRSSAFPPLHKNSTTQPAVHARPEDSSRRSYTFLVVRVDAPTCSFCCNGPGRNHLILQAACRIFSFVFWQKLI